MKIYVKLLTIFFFNGIGIESNKLKPEFYLKYENFIKKVENAIYEIQISYSEYAATSQKKSNAFFIYFNGKRYGQKTGTIADILKLHKRVTENNRQDVFIFEPKYFPFDGHVTRLGHYYRNLFEIVRFIVSKEGGILKKEQVLQYLKLLRKQMSNHEQLLLYYNAVVGVGNKWENDGKKNYLIEYEMIHNVPFPLADFGIPIKEKYKDVLKNRPRTFEWQWDN